MKLADLLTLDQIILDLKGEACEDAIYNILDHLIEKSLLSSDLRSEIYDALREREQQISTGIGCGVAIPHAFLESIDQVIAVFARSKDGVDFESLDNAPVNFIILLLVPEKERPTHLQTLAAIAKLFSNCCVRQGLRDAQSADEILAILDGRLPAETVPCDEEACSDECI